MLKDKMPFNSLLLFMYLKYACKLLFIDIFMIFSKRFVMYKIYNQFSSVT